MAEIIVDISYPVIKLASPPSDCLIEGIQQLSLAGNLIDHTQYSFPESLQILNIAENQIREVLFTVKLPNLRLLNLSNNLIESIKTVDLFENLQELYLAQNQMRDFQGLNLLLKLRLLDLSNNQIKNFTDLCPL